MRPNYAQDPPPTAIAVGGGVYPVNVDYRVWIDVQRLMREITPDAAGLEALEQAELLAFGGVLADESPEDVILALSQFLQGYPEAPSQGRESHRDPIVSFDYDINYIVLAIRNQSGIDLSYRRSEPFHWWEFLLEFKSLCGDHYIINLMEARAYDGHDKDLLKRKRACALPPEYSAEERAAMDEFSRQFEGIGG